MLSKNYSNKINFLKINVGKASNVNYMNFHVLPWMPTGTEWWNISDKHYYQEIMIANFVIFTFQLEHQKKLEPIIWIHWILFESINTVLIAIWIAIKYWLYWRRKLYPKIKSHFFLIEGVSYKSNSSNVISIKIKLLISEHHLIHCRSASCKLIRFLAQNRHIILNKIHCSFFLFTI